MAWSDEEIRLLAKAYFHVLREESAGRRVNKTAILNELDSGGFTRGIQYRKDECARISEQLQMRGLPIVAGWRPPGAVGRTPTSAAGQAQIWRVIEPMLPSETGSAPTEDKNELEARASRRAGLPPQVRLHRGCSHQLRRRRSHQPSFVTLRWFATCAKSPPDSASYVAQRHPSSRMLCGHT